MFSKLKAAGFDVLTLHHAEAILKHDMRSAFHDLESVLLETEIPVEELVRGGGGEGKVTQRLRRSLDARGWSKHSFEIKKIVNGKQREATTHTIDHVKEYPAGTFALEIEWNNKDPFFDRDLENFKRLHADGAISVGGIITRGPDLQSAMRPLIEEFAVSRGIRSFSDLSDFYTPTPRQKRMIEVAAARRGSFASGWAEVFVSDKFGEATTHWRKLKERVDRGVGNPCPLVLIGIPRSVVRNVEGATES